MVEHWFYHLQQGGLASILPDILEKTQANDWRVLLKVGPCLGSPVEEMARLDTYLWTYKKIAFLPHGRDDEPLSDAHPIVLSIDAKTADGFDVVVLVAGADMNDPSNAKRCITILDGGDETDRGIARRRWKTAKDAGLTTAYWKQDDYGKWIKPNL